MMKGKGKEGGFEFTRKMKILVVTLLVAIVFLIFGIITGDSGIIGNMIILGVFIVSIPHIIINYTEFKRFKEMELRFPDFLRDLVETTKAGLPLHRAIISASDTNYGPLSDEIVKMSNQLTWNVGLIKVLEQFGVRMKRNPAIRKIVRVLIETYKSGGEIYMTLDSLASTMNTIQETQKERESMLKQYVVAMYAISLIFIFIVVAINKLMVPIFENLGTSSASGGPMGAMGFNPCAPCYFQKSLQCFPCGIYSMVCALLGASRTSTGCYYLGLFFSMSFIQAIFNGLVAGQIGEGSVRAGLKHSLILLFITCGTFLILVRTGLLGSI
jgi:flagellar protein FlaJ